MDRVQAHRFFQALNHERIHRLRQLAPLRHGLILELLPLLFHINSKVLPGYVSDDTPAGLIDYQPDKSVLDRAQHLEKSFHYRRRALRRYPLRGLYLIHSQSHLTYPKDTTFELWLLHSTLPDEQRQLLEAKLSAISDWAWESGLHLNTRLLSESDVEHGILPAWELDQFYSCGLVLAGCQPDWWLSSPDEDIASQNLVRQAKPQRRQNAVSLVDFGNVSSFAPAELLKFSTTVLTQSLFNGRRLLDVHYLLACLTRTVTSSLSALVKQQIYDQQTDVAMFDPDYLRLQCLPKPVPHALFDAFYLQSQESLSKAVRHALIPWRRHFMEKLVQQWGWDKERLEQLDAIASDIHSREHAFAIEGESCARLLRQLNEYCETHQLAADEVLKPLRQLLHLRHEPNMDQVPSLPTSLRPNTDAERLYLTRFDDDLRWQLSRLPQSKPSDPVVYSHENLLQVLAYAVANRLLSRSNWLSVNDHQQRVTTASVVELSSQLLKTSLADTDLSTDPSCLKHKEKLEQIWLFVNMDEAADNPQHHGVQLSSKLNDPLNYSSYGQSLVMSIDGIVISSFGLVYHFRHSGEQAPLETLRYLLTWPPSTQARCQSWCPTPIFGLTIQQRMTSLVSDTIQHYLHSEKTGNLLLDIAGQPYTLWWDQGHADFAKRSRTQEIWQAIASNQEAFQTIRLDRYLDKDGLFNTLLAHQAADRVSVFVYFEKNTIICYLLDEFGNLIRQQYQHLTETTLIAHLHIFLSEILHRNQIPHLRFYRLSRSQQAWQTTPLAAPQQTKGYLPIRAKVASPSPSAECELHCGQHRFTGQADDPALFSRIHQLVLSLRQQQQSYPVYLNSLLFDDDQYYPASVYMQEKQRLEMLFNPD